MLNLNFLYKYTIHIGMKSGNNVIFKNLKTFDIKKSGAQVTSVSWEFHGGNVKILNLNVDQFESIVCYRKYRFLPG